MQCPKTGTAVPVFHLPLKIVTESQLFTCDSTEEAPPQGDGGASRWYAQEDSNPQPPGP